MFCSCRVAAASRWTRRVAIKEARPSGWRAMTARRGGLLMMITQSPCAADRGPDRVAGLPCRDDSTGGWSDPIATAA